MQDAVIAAQRAWKKCSRPRPLMSKWTTVMPLPDGLEPQMHHSIMVADKPAWLGQVSKT